MLHNIPSSIFNDVLGPVMIGPSSSHTAAPARIGQVAHMLFGKELAKIVIEFEEGGSFAVTYKAQGSDYGFIGGILGMNVIDEKLKSSPAEAEKRGIDVQFVIAPAGTPPKHPNFALINLVDKNGATLTLEAISTGGGMFEVTKYHEFPVSIQGACYQILAICESEEILKQVGKILTDAGVVADSRSVRGEDGRFLLNVDSEERIPEQVQREISALDGVLFKEVLPILPIVKKREVKLPFRNTEECLEYLEANPGKQLWELGCDYEAAISGKSHGELLEMMKEIALIMEESGKKALTGDYEPRGFLPPQTAIIVKNLQKSRERWVDMGLLNDAILWASAMMEYDICRGRTVAAPTGGSCGVIPGAVVYIGRQLGKSDEEIAKAMMATGLIGVFIIHQASFGGEVLGCQAEMGSACAMAAAGLVQMFGGTPKEGFAAAALTLQNMMGLICDPVAGVGNIPCVSRNSLGAANAVLSANMVMNGFDPYIPLDETIDCMWQVGNLMPTEFLCTGKGGLSATKTGKEVFERLGY